MTAKPLCSRHGILHKPSSSLKFWPKSFRKSSGIFDIFCITNYAWFLTFLVWQCAKFKLYLPYCGKYPKLLSTLWNYQCVFHKIIHNVNHLENLFHISSIEPTDLLGLPQILPQSAKFLPRACSRRSSNIPSLNVVEPSNGVSTNRAWGDQTDGWERASPGEDARDNEMATEQTNPPRQKAVWFDLYPSKLLC